MAVVTVAIPVRNGEEYLEEILHAIGRQRTENEVEILVFDSGSRDRSTQIARSYDAVVVEIDPSRFSHGATRNAMMEVSAGEHVAFLTQDATPCDEHWLPRLLSGFEMDRDVALTFGPYVARPDARFAIKREMKDFFSSFSPTGEPIVQRLTEQERHSYRRSPGPLTFFSDANGCVAKSAWKEVPYRNVPYAEDQLLASEMIESGFAKVFRPDAGVWHSHDYSTVELFQRCFDEWRGLLEVYGHVESASPRRWAARMRTELPADRAFMRSAGLSGRELWGETIASARYHAVRAVGSIAGSRANRMPPWVRRLFSLEGRGELCPSVPT